MEKRNGDIRRFAECSGVRLWEIAEELGMPDSSFSRYLRRALSDDEKENIVRIIEKVRKEHETNDLYLR